MTAIAHAGRSPRLERVLLDLENPKYGELVCRTAFRTAD
jgi:hypothetical protein